MRKHLAAGLMLSLLVIIILSDMVDNVLYSGTGSDEMKGFDDTVIVEFPLRGEWMAPNTCSIFIMGIPFHDSYR